MVRMLEDDTDRLEHLLRELCAKQGLHLAITGWTRKTFDVYRQDERLGARRLMVRVETLATTNGEVRFFDPRGREFAVELAGRLETEFNIPEAVVIRASDT